MKCDTIAVFTEKVLHHKIFPYYIPASCNLCDFTDKHTYISAYVHNKRGKNKIENKIIAFPDS